jgi:hypothetical protein
MRLVEFEAATLLPHVGAVGSDAARKAVAERGSIKIAAPVLGVGVLQALYTSPEVGKLAEYLLRKDMFRRYKGPMPRKGNTKPRGGNWVFKIGGAHDLDRLKALAVADDLGGALLMPMLAFYSSLQRQAGLTEHQPLPAFTLRYYMENGGIAIHRDQYCTFPAVVALSSRTPRCPSLKL